MNLRKLFNIPTPKQKVLLRRDIENVLTKCNKIAQSEHEEQKEAKESHDTVCPKCHATNDLVVNKIKNIVGTGKIIGNVGWGTGKINGTIAIDTDEISHCTKCGNEWKKYKIKYVSQTDIVRVVLKYLAESYHSSNNRFRWKRDAIKVFDNCHAETIFKLAKDNEKFLPSEYRSELKLRKLRKNHKSLFDINI